MSQPEHIRRQYEFAALIRQSETPQQLPDDIDPKRLKIYRDLFFNNVAGFLDGGFPVCAEILGAHRWQQISRDFFESHYCRSPYFLEISQEFLRYLEEGFQPLDSDPPYFYELAHYEWLELAVDVAEEEAQPCDANAELAESVPVLAAAAQGFMYQYPVNRISAELPNPEPEQTALIVFRDRLDQVRFLETNAMTLHLLIYLKKQELTGQQAVEQLLQDSGISTTEVAIQGGLSILEEWRQQGLILGGL